MRVGSSTPIIHAAVADMDATYGAYVAAEKNTLKNTHSNSHIDVNNSNKAKYSNNANLYIF